MSDRRPIGVFDSGVGGLTVLRAIHDFLPSESTIYIGDLAYFPYGPRSPQQVITRAHTISRFLIESDVKAIVVACNTATATALPQIQAASSVQVIGVVEPGARSALASSKTGRIGVVATEGTVRSAAYVKAIQRLSPTTVVTQVPCGLLVELVETGNLSGSRTIETVESVVSTLVGEFQSDTLILGCTHFPLVRRIFQDAAGPGISIIDSASSLVDVLATTLLDSGSEAPDGHAPTHEFLVTADPRTFDDHVRLLFGQDIVARTIDLPSLLPVQASA